MDNARFIYLDYNATTPPAPAVVEKVKWALETVWANPSSTHAPGLAAREAVQEAREEAALLLGVDSSTVVFTSGGTESNRLALWNAWWYRPPKRDRVIVSAVEHPSVKEAASTLRSFGADVVTCPVDGEGFVRLDKLKEICTERTALVGIMLANNEIGTVQPVREAVEIAHAAGAVFLCDAVQAVGKIPVRPAELGVDFLSVSGHKLYGPKGVGCLYAAPSFRLRPILKGSSHERGARPGTENVPGIVGLGEACRLVREGADFTEAVRPLRDRLEDFLLSRSGAVRVGPKERRLPNTSALVFEGVDGRALLFRLSRHGVAVAVGSACHSRNRDDSSSLKAMGISAESAAGFVRLSLGRFTTAEEVDEAAEIIAEEVEKLRRGTRGTGKPEKQRAGEEKG